MTNDQSPRGERIENSWSPEEGVPPLGLVLAIILLGLIFMAIDEIPQRISDFIWRRTSFPDD